jgi:protein involved in polysaccharide export with SLBB domain
MGSFRCVKYFVVILLLSACSPAVRNPATLQSAIQFPQAVVKEYRIQAGDQMDIKFFYNPELNEQVIVRPDGRISLQLANEMTAAGFTTAEFTEQLRKKYAVEISKPEIAVILRTFSAQRVYVDGEVTKPGVVVLTSPLTALQAIAQGGGFKDTARSDEVILIRRGVENKIISTMINLDKALDGTDLGQDVALIPFDIVYVPRSHIANVNVWVDQYVRKNLPISPGIGFVP